MSEELSIKVMIGGRTYPLTIKRDEEEVIRRAAKNINDSIKLLQDNYAVKDMQDLLAMTCLQIVTRKELSGPEPGPDYSEIENQLKNLQQKLDTCLE